MRAAPVPPGAFAADLADAIRGEAIAAGKDTPAVRGADWQTATVTAVATDGTVSVGAIIARRMDTYPQPQVGDRIHLTQSSSGNWLAVGRIVPTTGDDWVALTLLGTWAWVGGGTDPLPRCRITADGELQLSGIVNGTAVAIGAGANVATVPAAQRPTAWVSGVAPTSIPQNYARIRVDPSTGTVSLTNGSVALSTGSWVALDPIRGRAR